MVAAGTPADIMACPDSMTGAYLTGKRMIRVPDERRKPGRGCLKITGARANNLKNVTAKIEFGTLTVVTGVSGSGKSSWSPIRLRPLLRMPFIVRRVPWGRTRRLRASSASIR